MTRPADPPDRADQPPAPASPPAVGAHGSVDPAGPPRVAVHERAAGHLAPRPVSQWSDGFGRLAVRSGQALLVLAMAAVLVLVMIQLRLVVVPILIATLLAAAVSPLVRVLHRRGLPRALAVWVALLAGLAAIGVVVVIVVTGVRNEFDELTARASEGFDELEQFLVSGPIPIDAAQLEQARAAVVDLLNSEQVRTGAVAGATAAAEAVAGTFLAVVILFFLLKDGARIWDFLIRPVPDHRMPRMRRVGERSVEVLGGYVRGTAIVALVDAVIIGIALAVLQVPLAFPLALVVFIGAFIPLVGATIAGLLAVLVALVANGPVVALIVLAVVIAVNQIEGDVLAPIVLGRALSLHPLAILLALTAGTILAGVIGALLSVPMAAVGWAAVTAWNDEERAGDRAAEEPADAGTGAAGKRSGWRRSRER